MRLCSQLKSLERTRTIPILAISPLDDRMRLVRGLEIGVNDYLVPPIDKNELLTRVRTQVRKRRYVERLRDDVQTSLELAITDTLTGLHKGCLPGCPMPTSVRGSIFTEICHPLRALSPSNTALCWTVRCQSRCQSSRVPARTARGRWPASQVATAGTARTSRRQSQEP
jgi:response regulator of citrate/malate metabolism